MQDFSILIGGKSGDGIESSAPIIANIFNQLGFYIFIYRDYPSLIRGGHTFSIIRASKKPIYSYKDKVDIILALNQDCVDKHKDKINKNTWIIYDKNQVKSSGNGLELTEMVKQHEAPLVVRNIGLVSAMCKALGVDWQLAQKIIKDNIPKKVELNLKIAKKSYDLAQNKFKIKKISKKPSGLLYGNEAIALGLSSAGLDTYIAYPMTPASSVLHFLAEKTKDFGLKVVHPESEIGVIMMANGAAYAGSRVAVGTSGGGFALMTEGVSLSGMAELPVVVVMSQRPGPATGLPTYSSQGDLGFVLNSGHGEFLRIIAAPSDAEQAFYWSSVMLNLAWKYQTPAFVLVDKTLSESIFSFDKKNFPKIKKEKTSFWNNKGSYKRYLNTKSGISPMAFPGNKKAIVKANSYEHDEYGITVEDATITQIMQDKRLRKENFLLSDLENNYRAVKIYGNKKSEIALISWGSTVGVCREVAEELNIKLIQPVILSPMPIKQLTKALAGVKKIISIEANATAQLATLLRQFQLEVNDVILKYDGRPFGFDELLYNVRKVIK